MSAQQTPERLARLRAAIATVTALYDADLRMQALDRLEAEGASHGYRSGTYELRFASVTGAATSGAPAQLMRSWLRAAARKLSKLEGVGS